MRPSMWFFIIAHTHTHACIPYMTTTSRFYALGISMDSAKRTNAESSERQQRLAADKLVAEINAYANTCFASDGYLTIKSMLHGMHIHAGQRPTFFRRHHSN